MDDERIEQLLAAEALGSLDPGERAELEMILEQRPELVARLDQLQEAAGLLGVLIRPVQPHPQIKQLVLDRASASRGRPKARLAAGWRNPFAFIAGGVAAGAVATAIVVVILLGGRVATLEERAGRARAKTAEQVAVLSALAGDREGAVRLAGTENAPAAEAYLLLTADERVGVLVCSGLKRLPAEQAYQLWLNKGETRISGGLVNADYYGFALLVVRSPEPLTQFQTFGMTVEPAAGSPGPTGARVLRGGF